MRCSIIYLICVVFLIACNDVTVGYLETENAEYIPDCIFRWIPVQHFR